jgi:predicted acylesterase/phospholipase RssA
MAVVSDEFADEPPGLDKWPIGTSRALVLSGGGIKFAAHVGVMDEMSRWDATTGGKWLDRFDVIVGTSAGALAGALYAAGYPPPLMARLTRLFADKDKKFRDRLVDYNIRGLAASYLRSDTAAMLGGIRGRRLLTLLETLFSRTVRDELVKLGPNDDLGDRVLKHWRGRIRMVPLGRPDVRSEDADQLTFADCRHRLFLIGTNALTGQKTIFCRFPGLDKSLTPDQFEELAFRATRPDRTYVGGVQAIRAEITQAEKDLDLPPGTLVFRRLAHRAYTKFNRGTYGNVLPLAVAVRASLSMQGLFEPLRIEREPVNGVEQEDIFLDGGIDDTFSLSVAVDRFFGGAGEVLGISLSNHGYRLPDERAVHNLTSLLQQTTHYMGDAQLDFAQQSQALAGHSITIMNALTPSRPLLDLGAMADLVKDGATIARDFVAKTQGVPPPEPPARVPIDPRLVFVPAELRVYLSPAARVDRDALTRVRAVPPVRRKQERVRIWNLIPPLPVLSQAEHQGVKRWIALWLIILLLGAGFGNLIMDMSDRSVPAAGAPPIISWFAALPPFALVLGIVILLFTRVVALTLWWWHRDTID